MQLKLFFSYLLFTTSVIAGGFAGALERVWYFYAYQIDGLQPPQSRTLGFRCVSWKNGACAPDPVTKQPKYVECSGSLAGKRCTFDELLDFIDGGQTGFKGKLLMADSTGKVLARTALNPDALETAKKVFTFYNTNSWNKKVLDIPGYMEIKGGNTGYMKTLSSITSAVTNAKGLKTSSSQALFDGFADSALKIRISREGDQGRNLVIAAQSDPNLKGITLKLKNIGPGANPSIPSQKWQTVDWPATIASAGASSKNAVISAAKAFQANFLAPGGAGSTHQAVIQKFTQIQTQAKTCV